MSKTKTQYVIIKRTKVNDYIVEEVGAVTTYALKRLNELREQYPNTTYVLALQKTTIELTELED